MHKGGWPVGRPLSDEAKRKISEKAKARFADPEERAKQQALLRRIKPQGEQASEVMRQRMSTPEAKAAISERMKAHWADPEKRAAHIEASRIGARKPERRKRLSEFATARHAAKTKDERREWMMPAVVASQLANPSGIELRVGVVLDELGITYERQKVIGPITVDFYLPDTNTVFEVFGCYWHGCRDCGYKAPAERKRSDRVRSHILMRDGYAIRVAWEHAIERDARAAVTEALML